MSFLNGCTELLQTHLIVEERDRDEQCCDGAKEGITQVDAEVGEECSGLDAWFDQLCKRRGDAARCNLQKLGMPHRTMRGKVCSRKYRC